MEWGRCFRLILYSVSDTKFGLATKKRVRSHLLRVTERATTPINSRWVAKNSTQTVYRMAKNSVWNTVGAAKTAPVPKPPKNSPKMTIVDIVGDRSWRETVLMALAACAV